MNEAFQKAIDLIANSNKILLTTHENTDGDDLGSVLALSHYFINNSKQAKVVVTGGVPSRLEFMPGSDSVDSETQSTDFDLLIVSGCSTLNRIRNTHIENLKIPVINFDHHPDNQSYATVNVVDSKKSSVAELMYDFLQFANWEINSDMATCLLTGIITDTGLLMHSNTQGTTLEAVGELMKRGALVSEVAKHTFTTESPVSMRAWGKALENAYFNPETKMIFSVITKDQLAELGETELANFEGLVETLNKVPEAKYAMFLKEDGDRIKGSLRSEEYKGVDVQKIAQSLGGGGHKLAAGFSMMGKLAKTSGGNWEIV